MRPAFPAPDYYGSSAPSRRHQPTTGLPAGQLAADRGGGHRDGSHVHSRTVRRVRCPTMPLQHRHDYAAGLHRGLPAGDINRQGSSPHRRADVRCYPALIRQVGAGGRVLRGVLTLVPHVHLPVSLAGPRPSGSADPSRLRRGCLPPGPSVPTGQAAPSFSGPLRRAEGGVLSSPHGRERLVALDVPAPHLVGSGGHQLGLDVGGMAGHPPAFPAPGGELAAAGTWSRPSTGRSPRRGGWPRPGPGPCRRIARSRAPR